MSAMLDQLLDTARRADCAKHDQAMAQSLTPKRNDSSYGSYGLSCARCGGTPDGDSPRGFVGRCNCRGVQ